jgi:hypothetical protein
VPGDGAHGAGEHRTPRRPGPPAIGRGAQARPSAQTGDGLVDPVEVQGLLDLLEGQTGPDLRPGLHTSPRIVATGLDAAESRGIVFGRDRRGCSGEARLRSMTEDSVDLSCCKHRDARIIVMLVRGRP